MKQITLKQLEEARGKGYHTPVMETTTKGGNTMKKEVERKRLSTVTKKALYDGMKPGTAEWMECWKKNPKLQKEMLEYKKNYKEVKIMKRVEKVVVTKDRVGVRKGATKDDEKKAIEEFIRLKGAEKVTATRTPARGEEKPVSKTKAVLIKNKAAQKQIKEVVMKKQNKKVVTKTVTKKPEVKPVKKGVSFNEIGETFYNFAELIPANVKTISQLKTWMNDEKRYIIEFKHGELRGYQPERVVSGSSRVAKVTVKKCGNTHKVTYRSNKNSRIADED
jgi:hypothetical protein